MGNEHELRLHAHLFDQFGEAPDVGFVQGGIHFIEDAEWTGLILKDTSRASAVSAFSPPESNSTFCSFFPGGEATTSMPLSALFSSSVSRMKAWPPPNSFLKVVWKFSLILWNASSNFCREKVSISRIVACVLSIR